MADHPEPPVPAGMGQLSAPLKRFIEAFDVDPFLVQAAATASANTQPAPETDFRPLIARLPRQECDELLFRLVTGDASVTIALRKKLLSLTAPSSPVDTQTQRTVGQLLQAADLLQQRERHRKAENVRQKHVADMENLARRESQAWQEVETLVQRSQPKAYGEATRLLVKLKELAEFNSTQAAFQKQMEALRGRYKNRPSLLGRWRRAGLG